MRLWMWLGVMVAGMALAAPAKAAVTCGTPDPAGTEVCSVDPAIDPGALCNDGTVPAFWFRPGSGKNASTWILWLEGGSQCYDATSCYARATSTGEPLTSSTNWAPTDGVGLLSPTKSTNPGLYDANAVLVHYCSSDDWTGNYAAPAGTSFSPSNPASWNFQGHRVARAALLSVAELVPGFASASRIILGGDSAGGDGMTMNANALLPLLPSAATDLLVNDAGFIIDIGQFSYKAGPPYVSQTKPDAIETALTEGIGLWQATGDANCAAAAKTPKDQLNCLLSDYVLQNGFITLPTFVAESQLDQVQISFQLCPKLYGACTLPATSKLAPGQYAVQFATTMGQTLLGAGAPVAAYSVVSPDKYMHVILDDASEYNAPIPTATGQTSARKQLEVFLANPTGPRTVVIATAPGLPP